MTLQKHAVHFINHQIIVPTNVQYVLQLVYQYYNAWLSQSIFYPSNIFPCMLYGTAHGQVCGFLTCVV